MIAAITITYNRLGLTKRTVESFYSKTKVDYHLFVDNGSTDGTVEWLKDYNHILLGKNFGISYALAVGIKSLSGFNYILKLDNDIEVVTDKIVEKIRDYYLKVGNKFVVSPVDLLIDPNYKPTVIRTDQLEDYKIEYVSHTGGAFQIIPISIARRLVNEIGLNMGDLNRGGFFMKNGYMPVYLTNLEIKHIGLNNGVDRNEYKY